VATIVSTAAFLGSPVVGFIFSAITILIYIIAIHYLIKEKEWRGKTVIPIILGIISYSILAFICCIVLYNSNHKADIPASVPSIKDSRQSLTKPETAKQSPPKIILKKRNTITTKQSNTQNAINAPNALIATNNQNGDNTVNVYQSKPLPPLRERLTEILNRINPSIINTLKTQRSVCVMITQRNQNALFDIQDSLQIERIITLKSTGSESSNNTNTIGNCINDVGDGMLYGYWIIKLDNF
jgi:hypothetical protein